MLKRYLLYFVPVASGIIAATMLLTQADRDTNTERLKTQEYIKLQQQLDNIHQSFDAIVEDLNTLSTDNDLLRYSRTRQNPDDLKALTREFSQFHRNHPLYHSITLYDPSGHEIVHTENNGNKILIQPTSTPTSGEWLKQLASIQSDQSRSVYISDMHTVDTRDGNEPVLRTSTPVYNKSGDIAAILAIDAHVELLFAPLRRTLALTPYSHMMLANRNGFWLAYMENKLAWGQSDSGDYRMEQLLPKLWKYTEQQSHGQLVDDMNLYTFSTMRPLLPKQADPSTLPTAHDWIVVDHIPLSQFAELVQPNRSLYFGIAAFMIAGWVLIAFALAREQAEVEKAHRQLQGSEEQLRNIVSSTFNGIVTINEQGIIDTFNSAATRIFDHTPEEVIGRNISMLMSETDSGMHNNYIGRYIETGEAHIIQKPREVIARHKDGHTFPIELCVSARHSDEGWMFIGVMHDISRRKKMQQELESLATTDGLTGVRNRTYFNSQLTSEFMRAKRYDLDLSLLILDADHFKSVNDTYGHPAGDALLQAIAGQARACARVTDTVARYGGEEFAIILPETDGASAVQLAERLRRNIEQMLVTHNDDTISRTISVGVACLKSHECNNEDELLIVADRALYKAKEAGRNRVELLLF